MYAQILLGWVAYRGDLGRLREPKLSQDKQYAARYFWCTYHQPLRLDPNATGNDGNSLAIQCILFRWQYSTQGSLSILTLGVFTGLCVSRGLPVGSEHSIVDVLYD